MRVMSRAGIIMMLLFFWCVASFFCVYDPVLPVSVPPRHGYDLVYTLRFSVTISLFIMRGLLWAHVWHNMALAVASYCCKAHWMYYRYVYNQQPSPVLAYLLPLCLVSTSSICGLLVSFYIVVRVPARNFQSLWGDSSGHFAGLWAAYFRRIQFFSMTSWKNLQEFTGDRGSIGLTRLSRSFGVEQNSIINFRLSYFGRV